MAYPPQFSSTLTYEQRYGDKGFTKAHRDYYMEQMANLSDALKEYRLSQLTERSGTSFTNIGNYLGGFFGGKTKVGKKWTEFGPENALEHIKEYTNFYGQRSSLKMPPLPKGKVEVDKEEKVKVKKETKKALESVTVYDDQTIFTPENLVQIIKSPSSKATEKAGAEAALVK